MKEEGKTQDYMNPDRLRLLISNVGMRTLRLLLRERYKSLAKAELEIGEIVNISVSELLSYGEDESRFDYIREHDLTLDTSASHKWDYKFLFFILCGDMRLTAVEADHELIANDTYVDQIPVDRHAKQKQEAEAAALKVLRSVFYCLFLYDEPDDNIPNGFFKEWWEEAAGALVCLGAHEKDIQDLRSCPILAPYELSTTEANAENDRKSRDLRASAKGLLAAGKLKRGLQLYDQALRLSGLSAGEKSCLVSSRSEALLSLLEDGKDHSLAVEDVVSRCMDDARLAIQLEPKGWRGYFLEGRVFQLRKRFREAIDSFELALSLNPNSQDIITSARSECRLDGSDIENQIRSDPTFTPTRLSEIFESREAIQRLVRVNQEMMGSKDPVTRVRGMLFMGHRYQLGDEVPLDIKEAVEFFWGAAEEGSAEGAYYAGLNYLRGAPGVKRDIWIAMRLFENAANQPLKPGLENLLHNEAAARARAALGLLFEYGVVRVRSLDLALKWYYRGAVRGCGTAAMGQARLNSVGMTTIVKDLKIALQYQRLAVELGSGGAAGMHFLGRLYAEFGDLSQALYWSERATTLGYTAPLLERQEFDELLKHKEQELKELKQKLPTHLLSSKVPIHILHDRYVTRLGPLWLAFKESIRSRVEYLLSSGSGLNEPCRAEPNIAEIKQLATEGQEYARLVLEAFYHLEEGLIGALNKLISGPSAAGVGDDPACRKKMKRLALAGIAAYYTAGIGRKAASILSPACRSKLIEIVAEVVEEKERSDSDVHARVCHLNILGGSAPFEAYLEFAKVCNTLYPAESYFHERLAYAFGQFGKCVDELKVAEEGLKCCPNNWELLYIRAQCLCELELPDSPGQVFKGLGGGTLLKDWEEEAKGLHIPTFSRAPGLTNMIQAFQEFISRAPSGHPNIPRAYYQLVNLKHLSGDVSELESEFRAGVEAENSLLSHFLPYRAMTKELALNCLSRTTDTENEALLFATCSKNVLDSLLEVKEEHEIQEIRRLKLTNPKRTLLVRECRRRILSREVPGNIGVERRVLGRLGFCRSRTTTNGPQHRQQGPTPQEIPSLMMSQSTSLEELNLTIDQVHRGRIINLTIMEEYIERKKQDPIQTVVKDDNDEFSLIFLFNFDRSDGLTSRKLGFGSRIRLMNPYVSMGLSEYGGAVIRVDDPSSVLFLNSGDENPMCRYCWKPKPSPRCIKCKTAQYCNKECQRLDWEVLGHKDLCKVLRKRQQQNASEYE